MSIDWKTLTPLCVAAATLLAAGITYRSAIMQKRRDAASARRWKVIDRYAAALKGMGSRKSSGKVDLSDLTALRVLFAVVGERELLRAAHQGGGSGLEGTQADMAMLLNVINAERTDHQLEPLEIEDAFKIVFGPVEGGRLIAQLRAASRE
ncbi:hypothetical protein [Streptomyces sp. NPDC059943]|uniref:hypothetical protein n=1 Tax=Streptomyces sp. NPDC059943 TaxID=3347010 RepID=UPI003664B6FF